MKQNTCQVIFLLMLCHVAGCVGNRFNISSFSPLPSGVDECLASDVGIGKIYHIKQLSFKSTEEMEWILVDGTFLMAGAGTDSSHFPNHISHSAWFVGKTKDESDWKNARTYMPRYREQIGLTPPLDEELFSMPNFEMQSYLVKLGPLPYKKFGRPYLVTNALELVEAFVSHGKSYDEFVAKARAVYDKYVAFTDGKTPTHHGFIVEGAESSDWMLPVSEQLSSELLEYISDIWQIYGIVFSRNTDGFGWLRIYIQKGRFCITVYPTDMRFSMEPEVVEKGDYYEVWGWGNAATFQEIIVRRKSEEVGDLDE